MRPHQIPEADLIVRRHDVDAHLGKNHHGFPAPTIASRHSYQDAERKSSIPGNLLSGRNKAQCTNPPWLAAFQAFFREHSEYWLGRFDYAEAGPQLLLQAFLQRVANGGGRIEREYGLGRGRTDLLLVWPRGDTSSGTADKFVIECKVLHKSLERTVREGLEQTSGYMDRCGSQAGHLVIFDRSEEKRWEDKIFRREERVDDHTITVWGM